MLRGVIVSDAPEFHAFPIQHYFPEKALLAGILERTYRDLHSNGEQKERRDAIAWFRSHASPDLYGTFLFILDHIKLSVTQVRFLLRAVEMAEQKELLRKETHDKCKAEREASRVRYCSLVQR